MLIYFERIINGAKNHFLLNLEDITFVHLERQPLESDHDYILYIITKSTSPNPRFYDDDAKELFKKLTQLLKPVEVFKDAEK